MGKFVILNLAEVVAGEGGVTGKVKDVLDAKGRREVRRKRFLRKPKIEIVNDNEVVKYDLLSREDSFDRESVGSWFGLSIDTLMEIRQQCLDADRVYLCAHGSATDRNQVFYDSGMGNIRLLATVTELSTFVETILDPSAGKTYEVILIICFAARSGNPDQRHTKGFLQNPANLASSLAYKLFKSLNEARIPLRMRARLGEVRVSMAQIDGRFSMEILTQSEAGVIAGLQITQVAQQERQLKDKLTPEVRQSLQSGTRQPQDDTETAWLAAINQIRQLTPTQKQEGAEPKEGMLLYERQGNDLIISFENEEIYNGAML